MHVDLAGVVLRAVDYKESDRILTLLTDRLGLLTVKAQGCRRKNSPLAAAAQLLVYSNFTLFAYRDHYSVKEAAPQEQFLGLRTDLDKLSLASYFAEVAQCVGVEGESNGALLSLLLNSLYALDKLQKPVELIHAAFDLRCMVIAGYAPLLDACAGCGAEAPEAPRLDFQEGILLCSACGEPTPGRSAPLTPEMLAAARHIVYGDPKRLFSFRLPPGQLAPFAALASTYLTTQLERGFKTLDFYRGLGPLPGAH